MTSLLPKGFRAAGATCGIKESRASDLCLFLSDQPCSAAGVYTTNRVVGAPVIVSRERTPSADVRGVIINSGNANACTGAQGESNARQMTADVAEAVECRPEQILLCSTGIIGVQLPMDRIRKGVPALVEQLKASDQSLVDAATAMMTTDTFAKHVSIDVKLDGGQVKVAGVAKGAAMIAPNMATMLGVVMTDAELTSDTCDELLRFGVDRSFNCITVDGHTSTSDTVLLLANGASAVGANSSQDQESLRSAIQQVCENLATDIIRDAEGAEHFVTVDVVGFQTREMATRVAREIAESALVKTAIAGNDPNWGRITSAAGYAGIDFEAEHLSLKINGTLVYSAGTPTTFDEKQLSNEMKNQREVDIVLSLSGGPASGSESVRFWSSDLTQEYVRLNSEYTT